MRDSGPTIIAWSVASSTLAPVYMWSSWASMATSRKPASVRIPRRRSLSARAKGPGACGSGGSMGGRRSRAAASGAKAHGLSRRGRQQTKTIRPPGASAVRRLRKAAAGSAKNITPKREKRRSKSGANRRSAASATSNVTGAPPARPRASSIIGAEMSTPTTEPPGATRPAMTSEVVPQPQPTSRTRSPARGAARSITAVEIDARLRSIRSRPLIHRSAAWPFQYSCCVGWSCATRAVYRIRARRRPRDRSDES